MTFGSLFSGIGGIDLGLERAGFECRFQIEIDPYCNKILERHWPHVKRYGDITKVRGNDLEYVDLLAGGFPCQDVSQAGKQAGMFDPDGAPTRSGLWFEFARLVREIRPKYVLVENVPGLLVHDGMRHVIGELSGLGYVGCWFCLRASDFGASHLRKRVFIVAYADGAEQAFFGAGRTDAAYSTGREMAYRKLLRGERRGDGGDMGAAPPGELGEGLQRQRSGNASHDSGDPMAYRSGDGLRFGGASHDGNGHHAPGHVVDGRDTHVAHGAFGGLGELRQPSRCDGLADGSNTLVEHASHDNGWRGIGGTQAGTRQNGIGWRGSSKPDGTLADAECTRLEERNGIGEQLLRQDPESLTAGIPHFAPGPSDPRWPYILRDRPDLAPALANPKGHGGRQFIEKRGPEGRASAEGGSCGIHAGPGETVEPQICGVANGLPDWMDRAMSDRTKRLGRLGNAVVPDCVEYIGNRIREFESCR